MRIAVVSPYSLSIPGGVQQQVIELAVKLRDDGHEATVVGPGAAGLEDAVDVGGTVGIRANGSIAPIALLPGVTRRVRAALVGFDVVHIHEPFQPLVGWAALRVGGPKVLTFHADPSLLVRRFYRGSGRMLRRLVRDVRAVSAVSQVAESAMVHLFESVTRIPNGLDVGSYELDAVRVPHQVAFLGRPEPRKGRDLLLAAWPLVRQEVPDATLVIMGEGRGIETDGVRFAGKVDEVEKRSVLASSSVFCAPNRGGESFGITVAEGMAAGCAIVASDIPAFVDVLDESGVVFENGDLHQLARKISEVLLDEGHRREMARLSSRRVWEFDWESVTQRYVEMYEQALAAHA